MRTTTSLLVIALAALLPACVKDKMYRTYTITTREYVVKPQVIADARLQEPRAIEQAGSFALYGSTMFMNEREKGIHVIDYSNPSAPVKKGFIPIPGNTGVSIKNDVLYADCYCDLFVFRLQQGHQVEFQKAVRTVFNSRMEFAYDPAYVDVIEHHRDTTVSEQAYSRQHRGGEFLQADMRMNASATPNPPANISTGSSMAVFTIVGNHLYTVDGSNLNAFSLADPLNPERTNVTLVNHGQVETIFPFGKNLFIGTRTGMFIYDIDNPREPKFTSRFDHARVCDPVIADASHAFVTLRAGTTCGGPQNQLDVLDITDITKPKLIRSYPFTSPHGLSKDGNVLFLCDGQAGLKVIDVANVSNLVTKQELNIGKAIDVIALGQMAFVMLENSISIYSYDQQFNVALLGTINKN